MALDDVAYESTSDPAGSPEMFAWLDDPHQIRHLKVSVQPGPAGEAAEIWAGNSDSLVRILQDGEVVHESWVKGSHFVSHDVSANSAVVRSRFQSLDRRIPLQPILGLAFAIVDDPGFKRVVESPSLTSWLRTRPEGVRYEAIDLNPTSITMLEITSTGLPVRAVVDSGEIEWTWTLDEYVAELPDPMDLADDCFAEFYSSRLGDQAATTGAVVADYTFASPGTHGAIRFVELRASGAEAVICTGHRPAAWIPSATQPEELLTSEGDLFVQVEGAAPGALDALRDEIDDVLSGDATWTEIVRLQIKAASEIAPYSDINLVRTEEEEEGKPALGRTIDAWDETDTKQAPEEKHFTTEA